MEIRIRETGAVVYENEFRAMFPNTGFPAQLTEAIVNDFGGDVVLEGPQATPVDRYGFNFRNGVEQIDGKWFTKYSVGPVFTDRPAEGDQPAMTAAEQMDAYKAIKDTEQAKSVRQQRDDKLKESDWRVIRALESNTPQDFAWAAYRQALRDITAQPGFPWAIDWPENP